MNWIASKLFWLSVLLFFVYVHYAGSEYDEAKADSARYCENVNTWRQTRGAYGHPAYRGTKECGK